MATVPITGGPVKGELVSRMLSDLPVTFSTASGSIEVLIEEMQEADRRGHSVSFIGRIVAGSRTGCRVHGDYDCLRMNGTMAISTNGA
jgi:hypothetical protein